MALDGKVNIYLLGPTKVEIHMFVPSASFLKDYETTSAQLLRNHKTTEAGQKAHATALNRFAEDDDLIMVKYLVKFEKTGETLTNSVYNPQDEAYGAVRPKFALVGREFEYKGRTYGTTTIHAEFNIARVEPYPRKAIVAAKKKKASNWADESSGEEDGGTTQQRG